MMTGGIPIYATPHDIHRNYRVSGEEFGFTIPVSVTTDQSVALSHTASLQSGAKLGVVLDVFAMG